ncbi:hypothetical protein ACRE_025920 [Hapsidospora chrysogenum ATCC 11550]|uniref:Uncharacterized protein n=1 Tax=Hapsidospora chrysogenum (strain ATCC 11550 / CBS 779.69 / DSM 880 / IAM 14645 / JCM 23072 / IMI 49137) TaxID=857340 RepID=A0A086TAX9_HAPC1|nr:hypothetical protein ACRE_025920 [Hapsidospora chrysogenum ATCC 11550]
MKTSLAALVLASLAASFNVAQYLSKRCTGLLVPEHNVTADRGCVVAREDGYLAGLVNDWTGDEDNNLVLALYRGKTCCHADLIKTVDWEDSCIEIESGETVGSFRAVDPNVPDDPAGGYDSCEADDDSEQPVEGVPPSWDG